MKLHTPKRSPTVVVSAYTPDYSDAGTDSGALELRAGLRTAEDWLVELELVTLPHVRYLQGKYAHTLIHYMVNDDSVDVEQFESAVVQATAPKRAPTIALYEALSTMLDLHSAKGSFEVTIDGATWTILADR